MNLIRHSFSQSVAALLTLLAAMAPQNLSAETRIEKRDYHGWQNSYRLSNGMAELVVAPEVARIMSYSLADGKNVLWEDSALWGKSCALTDGSWTNYGGHKLWLAPQKAWTWPPDPALDRGACEVELTGRNSIRLTGMKSAKHGICFIRDISLANDSSAVTIVQTMKNVSDKEVSWGIWEVTQMLPLCAVALPASATEKSWGFDSQAAQRQWSLKDSVRLLKPNGEVSKVFVTGEAGWIAARMPDNVVYMKLFASDPKAGYPDGEANCEVFTCERYTELEVVSPLRTLKPGEQCSCTEHWLLLKPDVDLADDKSFVSFVQRKMAELGGQGAMSGHK